MTEEYNCDNDISTCICLKRLKTEIDLFGNNEHQYILEMEYIKMQRILNDYLHLIDQHNEIEQFEYIMNQLKPCAINECKIVALDQRNRIHIDSGTAYCDIMDKIHVYYHHAYDVGYLLSIEERSTINKSHHQEDNKENDYLCEDKIFQIFETQRLKRQKFNNISSLLNNRQCKYNNLFADQVDTDTKQNDDVSYDKYSYGYRFYYGYKGETGRKDIKSIDISKYTHFSTLKEELTQNDIAILPIKTFNNEYKKAGIHFESLYRKKMLKDEQISLDHILSLMVYCNYTELQYQFSKTYRESNGTKHATFYHLGKYLKCA
eukprot:402296_1